MSAWSPEGRSMARTGTPLPLIVSMQSPMAPPTSRASPVPSKASTMRSCCGNSAASKACGTMPAAMAASAAVRASPLSRPCSAHSSTVTASPAAWARRATTYPSPALLPAPHTTASRRAAGQCSPRTAKAAAPARSMRVMPAMPQPSMAARSSRRTPSAVYRYCGSRMRSGVMAQGLLDQGTRSFAAPPPASSAVVQKCGHIRREGKGPAAHHTRNRCSR